VKRGARRVARRARKAWRQGNDKDAPEDRRHLWRQREKDRLYAASLLGAAWPTRRRHGASARLVKLLGKEHDLALLAQRLEQSPSPGGAEAAALKALRSRREQLVKRARRAAEQLHEGRA
ncbi:MAG: CHAD domain-containing protein, partial [Proteobacteria bacterium]|nr:CHAD domain-containing protein [Pseudomonadota bacterium]